MFSDLKPIESLRCVWYHPFQDWAIDMDFLTDSCFQTQLASYLLHSLFGLTVHLRVVCWWILRNRFVISLCDELLLQLHNC